jgi:Flp pilus assembly pilin Flp
VLNQLKGKNMNHLSSKSKAAAAAITSFLRRLRRDVRGAITFVEIVIIIAVIAVIIIVGFKKFAGSTSDALEASGEAVDKLGGDIGGDLNSAR